MADNNISKIIEDKEGNLYVGTAKATLHRYNREQDCFERLNSQNKNYPYAPLGKGFTFFKAAVLGFVQDRESNYWVSTFSGGLNYFDLKHNLMKHYPDLSDDSYQLGSKNVEDIYEDRQGIIWLSVFKNGVYKVIPSHKRFHPLANNSELYNLLKDSDVRVLLEDSHGTFWIGTSTDIFRFYPSTGMIKNYSNTFNFNIRFIDALYEDSKAGMWFCGAGVGLNRIDLKTGIVKRYLPDDKIESFPSWSAQTMSAENDSILWLGCEDDGLIHFNINSKTFIQYKNNLSNERSLSDNTVWYTMIDQKKDLWLGTNNGLNHFNRLTGDFDRFLSGVEIHVILEDRKNNLWLGTINNGLIRFNIKTGKSVSFDKADGLLGNDIFALLEDDQGYIWIGSAAGLNRLDPSSMTFTSFKKEDGVQSRLTIWADATLKTKNGKLLFGGNEGITAFAPDQFKVNTFPPYVSITGLSIFDKPYKEKGILDSIITLDYNQNDLTIEYVGLHFKNPSNNKYMVKLEPYEKGWSKPSYLRKARYTNLAPGKYIFYVKASNSDGVWNEEGKKLSIIISPPIWATWWAYSFYIFVIFGFLYSTRKFELNRQKKNSEIKESKLRAEAAELQAKAAEAQAKVIQAENERKTEELEEARQLQLSMLPNEIPSLPHLNISVYMKTATEVGGDYYDFSTKEDDSLNICIGDATGHGMKAGTIVSMMKSLFTANSIDKSLEDFFTTSNYALKNSKMDKMMMAFAMININSNKLKIANAGIPPIYIYRKMKNIVEEINLNGLPIGAMKNSEYDIYEGELAEGDTILMLSDGFPELRNVENEMFGYEKLKKVFANNANKSSEEIISILKEDGSRWVNDKDPNDDVTFVVIKVK